MRGIGNKLPSALKYAYNRYAADANIDKSELEKLAEFLYKEAELAVSGGIFDVEATEAPELQKSYPKGSSSSKTKTGKVCAAAHNVNEHRNVESDDNNLDVNLPCVFCKLNNHQLWECTRFAKEPLNSKYLVARNNGLCFNCLKKQHIRENCKELNGCSHCKRRHHSLLHSVRNMNNNTRKETSPSVPSGNKNVSGSVNTMCNSNKSKL